MILVMVLVITGCEDGANFDSSESGGQGGSLARFAIKGDYLYTVDHSNLNVFDIAQPAAPKHLQKQYVDFGIQTIYPFGDKLYLGSQFGMYTYDISDPSQPQFISNFTHIYSCDPVVVDGEFAYVTLSTESWCGRNTNELLILDITEPEYVKEVAIYNMHNPKGLGIDGDTLFLCDEGLKVYDVSNPKQIQLLQQFSIRALDVIPYDERLLVIGPDGLKQYDYSGEGITLLSEIPIKNDQDEAFQ